jgi:hypothetical protein
MNDGFREGLRVQVISAKANKDRLVYLYDSGQTTEVSKVGFTNIFKYSYSFEMPLAHLSSETTREHIAAVAQKLGTRISPHCTIGPPYLGATYVGGKFKFEKKIIAMENGVYKDGATPDWAIINVFKTYDGTSIKYYKERVVYKDGAKTFDWAIIGDESNWVIEGGKIAWVDKEDNYKIV